jgi:transcriptional regulator NrdR family protein
VREKSQRLTCPLPGCGGDLGAERNVRKGKSTILRRRVCRKCGYEVTTKEFIVDRSTGFRRVIGKLLDGIAQSTRF